MHTVILSGVDIQLGSMLFVLVSFLVLMLILKKFAYGPLTKIMDERANKISDDLDNAEAAKRDAAALAEKRQAELDAAKAQSAQILADAQRAAHAQSDAMLDETRAHVQRLEQEAIVDAQNVKQAALHEAQGEVADLSVAIANKVLRRELSLADHKALIDDYINDLKKV